MLVLVRIVVSTKVRLGVWPAVQGQVHKVELVLGAVVVLGLLRRDTKVSVLVVGVLGPTLELEVAKVAVLIATLRHSIVWVGHCCVEICLVFLWGVCLVQW